MGSQRTAWHFHFTIVLNDGRCTWVDVRDEVALSEERPRVDYLLLRRIKDPSPRDTGKTLKRMWPLIPREAVVEFKSIGRPYRQRALDKLLGYLHWYYADNPKLIGHAELAGMLIVPCRTPTLDEDVREIGLEYRDMKEGYWELMGGFFQLYVVEIDVVGDTEPDGVLKSFGHCNELTDEAQQFWANQLGTKEANVDASKLEGHKEIVARFLAGLPVEERLQGLSEEQLLAHFSRKKLVQEFSLEERLAGLAPQERLAGLAPQERLAGLAPQERLAGLAPQERLAGLAPQERLAGLSREELLLAMPDEELRRLPESYLATFPEPVREAVRQRLKKK